MCFQLEVVTSARKSARLVFVMKTTYALVLRSGDLSSAERPSEAPRSMAFGSLSPRISVAVADAELLGLQILRLCLSTTNCH